MRRLPFALFLMACAACSAEPGASSSGSSGSSAQSGSSGGSSASSSGGTTTSTSASSSSSTGASGSGSTGGAAQLDWVVALQLDHDTYAPGQVMHASVTLGNRGGAPATVQRVVITARPPGGTHAGGPYDDFAPVGGPATLQPGDDLAVDASFTLPGNAPTGAWEVYPTYEDWQGVYHDGPSGSVIVAFAGTGGSSGSSGSSGTTGSSAGGGYTVVGNTIYDANQNPHLFHGVDRTSLEWSSTGYNLSLADYQAMASWHSNVVRIALNQDYWLAGAAQYDPSYRATVAQNVSWAEQAGMDVILDLHWSDRGDLSVTNSGQQSMGDVNSVAFWSEVADAYKGDPRVLFELYNEPNGVDWNTLINGGPTPEGWMGHGMQELYDTVRATGAQNLVIVGGLDYAYDLSGAATLKVSGFNIVYATHPYSINGARPPTDWDRAYGFLTATDPVIATEFGQLDCGTDYVSAFIAYADAHNMSWTAWAWWPGGCSFPSIIDDWSYTVSAMGAPIHDALINY